MQDQNPPQLHIPIMKTQIIEKLIDHYNTHTENFQKYTPVFIDGTFGRGGHTKAFLDAAFSYNIVMALDRDIEAYVYGTALAQQYTNSTHQLSIHHSTFTEWHTLYQQDNLIQQKNGKILGMLFDLGVSSTQLDDPERGFSWRFDSNLTMTMGLNNFSAADVVNTAPLDLLINIFSTYGEEPQSKKLASLLVQHRVKTPFTTTQQLSQFIEQNLSRWDKKIHRATLVFQALRMYVNEEIQQLNQLCSSLNHHCPSGTLVMFLTFHSIEDRIIKNLFRDKNLWSDHEIVPPSEAEISINPRSRSAKLRIGIKI